MRHLDMKRDELNFILWRTPCNKDKGQVNCILVQNWAALKNIVPK